MYIEFTTAIDQEKIGDIEKEANEIRAKNLDIKRLKSVPNLDLDPEIVKNSSLEAYIYFKVKPSLSISTS